MIGTTASGKARAVATAYQRTRMSLPAFTALAGHIEQKIGLAFAAGDPRLEAALADHPGATFSPTQAAPQWDAFVEDLLVHETYFFRHPRQFEAIESMALPELRESARRQQRGTVAIWSASCATGEETWTMALIANAVMATGDIGFRIHGSDLSAAALEIARRAVYRRSTGLGSFRNLSASQLARFPGLDDAAQSWSPSAELRRSVRLFRHNLLERAPTGALDLILCRNTLIYMSAKARCRVLDHFAALLRSGGYLALGPAETPEGDQRFEPAEPADALLYRRRPDAATKGAAPT
jgi:chemotaxis methyl-accepting protein methylase